jgi:hypothetical protein
MKKLTLAFALLAAASPAAAQHSAQPRPTSTDAARLLDSPEAQDIIAHQIVSLADIVLDTRVGPLSGLADPRDDVRPGDTIHSIVRRRDPDYDRHLYESSRHAAATAGAVASSTVQEVAELRRTAARLRAALEPLIETAKALEAGQ